jgi:hypothetical protein
METSSGKLTRLIYADFYHDGIVDWLDYNIYAEYEFWGSTHGQGDANGDGHVDELDADIFFEQLGLAIDWIADPGETD